MVFDDGPYVQAACFCDLALQDTSGAISLIRVIDTIYSSGSGPNSPEEMPSFNHSFNMVIMLKSGMARGRHDMTITPEMPNGEAKDPLLFSVHFEGEEKGANIITKMEFQFKYEGLYWFNIKLGENLLTAIPLRVKYQRSSIIQS